MAITVTNFIDLLFFNVKNSIAGSHEERYHQTGRVQWKTTNNIRQHSQYQTPVLDLILGDEGYRTLSQEGKVRQTPSVGAPDNTALLPNHPYNGETASTPTHFCSSCVTALCVSMKLPQSKGA